MDLFVLGHWLNVCGNKPLPPLVHHHAYMDSDVLSHWLYVISARVPRPHAVPSQQMCISPNICGLICPRHFVYVSSTDCRHGDVPKELCLEGGSAVAPLTYKQWPKTTKSTVFLYKFSPGQKTYVKDLVLKELFCMTQLRS